MITKIAPLLVCLLFSSFSSNSISDDTVRYYSEVPQQATVLGNLSCSMLIDYANKGEKWIAEILGFVIVILDSNNPEQISKTYSALTDSKTKRNHEIAEILSYSSVTPDLLGELLDKMGAREGASSGLEMLQLPENERRKLTISSNVVSEELAYFLSGRKLVFALNIAEIMPHFGLSDIWSRCVGIDPAAFPDFR